VERVRRIRDSLYTTGPSGLCGNEDCGQLSSWYVLAALGMYPVCPGSDQYLLGNPLFERVDLRVANDRTFTIRRHGSGHQVQGATLHGTPVARSDLTPAEILRGGELEFELGERPNRTWGRSAQARPRSRVANEPVLAAPFARCASHRFRDSLTVALAALDSGVTIRYAPDTSERWTVYERPLTLRESTQLRFFAADEVRSSPVVSAFFHRIPHDWSVRVLREPAPQYTGGGVDALIDGLRGRRDWRTGSWQGYRNTDFEAIVDLGRAQRITQAGGSFLQDVRSWIWMPTEVSISVSTDGERFDDVGRVANAMAEDEYGVLLQNLVVDIVDVEARFVRVRARNYGTIPDWHPGRGERAWIFIDEIVLR
jgi:hypothetical protein